MSFTVPQDIVEHLNKIFPKSNDRIKIALTLLGYDHYPTRAEWREIAKAVGKDPRTVELVLERLVMENLFASEIGSVPMWRIHEKDRLSLRNIQPASVQAPVSIPAQPILNDPELPIFPIDVSTDALLHGGVSKEREKETEIEAEHGGKGETNPETRHENPSEPGVVVPVRSDLQMQEIKTIKSRQEGFETVIKAEVGSIKNEIGDIKELLKKALEQPKPVPPEISSTVPVVSGLKGQPQQPAAEIPAEQAANPRPAASPNPMDPFASMSKEEVVEFYQNNPTMAGRRLPGGLSETYVNSPPETIRKLIIEVTTYTQMLYEKALADGAFEGTFSDFLNWAPQKYFEDRGLSLGWHKVDRHPGGRYG